MERLSPSGAVFQNPSTQILCDHVGPETAFSLENGAVPPERMPEMVQHALAEADLPVPTHTTTASLSMGRQYRLVLAGALVTKPGLLLLDEPCAQLDPDGCKAVAKVIDRVRARGGGVLLCEHEPEALTDRITHWWKLDNGTLLPAAPPNHAQSIHVLPQETARPDNATAPLARLSDIHLAFGDKQIFSGLDVAILPGEAIHIEGKNGSGKSTLIRVMTGFLAPDSGTATLFGEPVSPANLRGRVGLVLQNPVGQLFEDTTEQELLFAAKRKGLPHARDRVRHIAEVLGISSLLDRAPHLLSYGQQRLVTLGACLTQEPELLILDDPFAGLDMTVRTLVRDLLDTERNERGMAVIITGHNPPSPLRFTDFYTHELRFAGGRLESLA
ncbi:ABC transporter ATP-binding protein [Pseudodesulfovibrio sediminis]|uniref:ABC transporter ATP-binding protein n=1 Tax=Pseudodesulfovibrio sediminis TaxID=2810563 RepID=A0ABN6EP05_9BACT|nr:ABC transporter ATP-binding protein [Pseudodesulfovibrio sediminis]